MKIGLMGGSFDPVHNAHIKAAMYVKEQLSLDKVIFIPAWVSPFKTDKRQADAEHRYNMLCMATQDCNFFEVSRFELDGGGVSYTYITAEYFAGIYKNDEIYFIMGDEAYAQFNKWKNPERIRAAAKICVVTRDCSEVDGDAVYVSIPPMAISSTQIRESIRRGEDVSNFICPPVYQYIKEHNLYEG